MVDLSIAILNYHIVMFIFYRVPHPTPNSLEQFGFHHKKSMGIWDTERYEPPFGSENKGLVTSGYHVLLMELIQLANSFEENIPSKHWMFWVFA